MKKACLILSALLLIGGHSLVTAAGRCSPCSRLTKACEVLVNQSCIKLVGPAATLGVAGVAVLAGLTNLVTKSVAWMNYYGECSWRNSAESYYHYRDMNSPAKLFEPAFWGFGPWKTCPDLLQKNGLNE